MVDESGLRTVLAGKVRLSRLHPFRVIVTTVALTSAAGCVYFNSLYNANRLFKQGVSELDEGREATGRATLGSAIEKAQPIVANKPNSRWADDALRLIVRARILREDWPEAAEASQELIGYARSAKDTAEAVGYMAQAQLRLGNPALADSLLTVALGLERDEARQTDLLVDRGRARAEIGNYQGAYEDFEAVSAARPDWVTPRIDQVRLLVDSGQGERGAEEFEALLRLPLSDREERTVVELAEHVAAVDTKATADGLIGAETADLLPENRAYLVKMRADAELALGDYERARADLYLTTTVAGDSRSAAEAQATLVRMDLRQLTSVEVFDSLMTIMDRVAAQRAGRRSSEVRELHELMVKVDFWISTGALGYLLAAETARDLLEAPRLARHLFLTYAAENADALWAPKAILAALYLTPLDSDPAAPGGNDGPSAAELRERLLEDYQDSAYVQAFFGGVGAQFTFQELEEGLRRQLERLETMADQELRARRSGAVQPSGGAGR